MITSDYIRNVLDLLLDGDGAGSALRHQLDQLTEFRYQYTGAGLFVNFDGQVDPGPGNQPASSMLNGVRIQSPELECGADAMLFYNGDVIHFLEIFAFAGDYPEKDLTVYTLEQVWIGSPGRIINVGV